MEKKPKQNIKPNKKANGTIEMQALVLYLDIYLYYENRYSCIWHCIQRLSACAIVCLSICVCILIRNIICAQRRIQMRITLFLLRLNAHTIFFIVCLLHRVVSFIVFILHTMVCHSVISFRMVFCLFFFLHVKITV